MPLVIERLLSRAGMMSVLVATPDGVDDLVISSDSVPKSAISVPLNIEASRIRPSRPTSPPAEGSVPRVTFTTSMLLNESVPEPIRLESLTMTLTSPTVLTNVSIPSRPSVVSRPASPRKTLSRLFPDIVSAALLPTTFSMPSLLKSVTNNPDFTSCAVVCVRSTVSPTPPVSVTAERSRVSLSALATSTILTLVDVPPTNT